ncbi:hypothetical protein AMECASPLE_030204 [Ameca splendens]|uniref:Uncharacterized protein n=1 Tax=Ameca splendens TaxID=208324 RepID=A0ABV0Y5T1_9TELE
MKTKKHSTGQQGSCGQVLSRRGLKQEHCLIYHAKTERVWYNCKPANSWPFTLIRRVLIREATKRLIVTLEELQRSKAQVGEFINIIKNDMCDRTLPIPLNTPSQW